MSLAWSSVKALSIPVGGTARDVKRVAVGGVTLWEKPNPVPYDAEVEYIESTGTQCIDTGFVPVPGMGMTLVFEVTTDTPNSKYFFGSVTGWKADRFCLFHQAYNDTFAFYASPSSGTVVAACPQGSKLSFVLNENGSVTFAGTTKTLDTSTINCTVSLSLFARKYAATKYADFFPGLRIYSCTITHDGVLVRDFQPVRVGSGSSAVGYLYDRANPTGGPLGNGLYGNSGSGAFVIGPDANA